VNSDKQMQLVSLIYYSPDYICHKLIMSLMKKYSYLKKVFLIILPFALIGQTNKNNLENNLKYWHQKDYEKDGILGLSLDKFYDENKKKTQIRSVIVAVIDSQIDFEHEDFKGQVWTNLREIPNNNIDDDKNGYVDDINGWNFTGTKKGSYVVWANYEYVRFVREWKHLFKDKTEAEIPLSELSHYKEYIRAVKMLDKYKVYYKGWLKSLKHNVVIYPLVKDTLKYFFPKEDYTYKQLDSMYKIYKINDKTYKQRRDNNDQDLGALIENMMVNFEVNEKTLEVLK
jgi:cell wall-associated protease